MSKEKNVMKPKETMTLKCLHSSIHREKKVFTSIFTCKQKARPKTQFSSGKGRETFHLMGVNGPLIVTHNTIGLKIKEKPKRHHFDDLVKVEPYNYFQQHKHCCETKYYWFDLLHPKILRHYSREAKRKRQLK